jgi:hypothetical protein
MLSMQLFRLIADERERMIEGHLRVQALLRRDEPADDGPRRAVAPQPAPWRARTPRARATTR